MRRIDKKNVALRSLKVLFKNLEGSPFCWALGSMLMLLMFIMQR